MKTDFIILCGLKHCGKSTLGRMLSDELEYSFTDSDDLVLAAIQNQGFSTIREYYAEKGADSFRGLEQQIIGSFLEEPVKPLVLSTGGGFAEQTALIDTVAKQGLLIYIRADEKLLYRRIMEKGHPAMLSKSDPEGDFHKMYQFRDQVYATKSARTIDVEDVTIDENFTRLSAIIKGVINAR